MTSLLKKKIYFLPETEGGTKKTASSLHAYIKITYSLREIFESMKQRFRFGWHGRRITSNPIINKDTVYK